MYNAPQTLWQLMDMPIPYNLKMHVFVYLDDLLVVSQDFDQHMTHLLEVATQLRKAALTINVKKNSFASNKEKYLGYTVGNSFLRVNEDKVRAISDFPARTGWYQRFICEYLTVPYPLTELLTKKNTFSWTSDSRN